MAKQIGTVVPDIKEEVIKYFKKIDKKSYKMIVKTVLRNRATNHITSSSEEESEDLFEITNSDDFDEIFEYDDIDGSKAFLKFKKTVVKNEKK